MNQEEALNKLMEMFPGRTVSTQIEYRKEGILPDPNWYYMIYVAAVDGEYHIIIYSEVSWEYCFDELAEKQLKEIINESK